MEWDLFGKLRMNGVGFHSISSEPTVSDQLPVRPEPFDKAQDRLREAKSKGAILKDTMFHNSRANEGFLNRRA